MDKDITVRVCDLRLIYQAIPYCGDNIFTKGLKVNEYKVTRKSSAHWCIDLHWVRTRSIVIIDQSIALIVLGIIWRAGLFI